MLRSFCNGFLQLDMRVDKRQRAGGVTVCIFKQIAVYWVVLIGIAQRFYLVEVFMHAVIWIFAFAHLEVRKRLAKLHDKRIQFGKVHVAVGIAGGIVLVYRFFHKVGEFFVNLIADDGKCVVSFADVIELIADFWKDLGQCVCFFRCGAEYSFCFFHGGKLAQFADHGGAGCEIFNRIVDDLGVVGRNGSKNFWLSFQHSGNVVFCET